MKDDKSTISKPVQFLYIKLVMSHRENLHSERIGILIFWNSELENFEREKKKKLHFASYKLHYYQR